MSDRSNRSAGKGRRREKKEKKRNTNNGHIGVWFISIVLVAFVIAALLWFIPADDIDVAHLLDDGESFVIETEADTQAEQRERAMVVTDPGIDEQLLTVNEWSRPGEACSSVDYIVIHYLGNPMTTAQQNHDYFESLKNNDPDDPDSVSMSANFVIGLEGEIIECVPPGEIAYASNSYNSISVSIENCHPDATGRFTEETYESLIKLTAYLCDMYDLERDQIIRHYDVTGKLCPLYYVEHEDKWEEFKDQVMEYLEECREAASAE